MKKIMLTVSMFLGRAVVYYFIFLGSMFALTACVNKTPLPAGWEKPVLQDKTSAKGACADISGVFNFYGKNIYRTGIFGPNITTYEPFISFINKLEEKDIPRPTSSDAPEWRVVIKQTPGSLEISITDGTHVIVQKTVEKDGKQGFTCTKDGIVVNNEGIETDGLAIGYETDSFTLYKTRDGKLIIKCKSSGAGIGLIPIFPVIMPIAGSETDWTRFDPYDENNQTYKDLVKRYAITK